MSTFLFTRIENLPKLRATAPELADAVWQHHNRLLETALLRHKGNLLAHTPTGTQAFFDNDQAIECALDIQRQVNAENWIGATAPQLCIALHDATEKLAAQKPIDEILRGGRETQIRLTQGVVNSQRLPAGSNLKNMGNRTLEDSQPLQTIYMLVVAQLPQAAVRPTGPLAKHAHNLPPQSGAFIGREQELQALRKNLQERRIQQITLVGQGGIGKTRLALQFAIEQITAYADGVYLIPLAPLSSGEFIVSTTADAIHCRLYAGSDPWQQLCDYLHNKETLLIMDGFEHLIPHAPMLTKILKECPEVHIIATSRVRLGIAGELLTHISGLATPLAGTKDPASSYTAGQLFLQNARRVYPEYKNNPEEQTYIARICKILEGSPLGIKLAATWIRTLSCEEILEEIETSLDFLATPARDLPSRHRSLRAVLDYSWKLLTSAEKQALQILSIFRGGFSTDAAYTISGANVDLLTELAEKSLLQRSAYLDRYQMPLALRQYTAEQFLTIPAAQQNQARERHCHYYTQYLQDQENHIQLKRQKDVLNAIGLDIENIRASWNWAIRQYDYSALKQALNSLTIFYHSRSWIQEGFEMMQAATLEIQDDNDPQQECIFNQLRLNQGWFAIKLSDYTTAETLIDKSMHAARARKNAPEIAMATYYLGYVRHRQGNNLQAKALFEDALQIHREHQDHKGVIEALNALGSIAHTTGDYPKSIQYREESLRLSEEKGYYMQTAVTSNNLGYTSSTNGQYEKAQKLYRKSIHIFKELGNLRGTGSATSSLATTTHHQGRLEEAKALYEQALGYYTQAGHHWGIAYINLRLGAVSHDIKDYSASKKYCKKGIKQAKEVQNRWGIAYGKILLGLVNIAEGKLSVAWKHLTHGVKIAQKMHTEPLLLEALYGLACFYNAQEMPSEAAKLARIVSRHTAASHYLQQKAHTLLDDLPRSTPPEIPVTDLDLDHVVAEIIHTEKPPTNRS